MRRNVQKMQKSREKTARKRTQHDMINQKKNSDVRLAEKVMGLRSEVLLTCPDSILPDH